MSNRPWEEIATIRVGTPSLGDRPRLHQLLDDILDRRWLTNHGPLEREFEARLCEVVGTRHCIPVCNATTGLLVAMKVLMLRGEVLMPSFTFPAVANAARMIGLEPVFCDIDPVHHVIDPSDAADRITPATSGLVGVHLWGRSCDTVALERAMGDRPVIYDAAHAFASVHDGVPIGSRGRCEVFSFHATKLVNAFEGGAIATDDDAVADELRLMINFGFSGRDAIGAAGINAKMSEIHAAMGLVSLDLLPAILASNREHHEQYRSALACVPGVRLITEADGRNLSYIVVEINETTTGVDRDDVMEALHERGIDARRYFHPGVHRMDPYAETATAGLDVTEAISARVLQLPTGHAVTADDVGRACRALVEAVSGS